MQLLYIIYYFWNNTFSRMVKSVSIASFTCESFYSINIWGFFLSAKIYQKEPNCKSRQIFDISVSLSFQPTIIDKISETNSIFHVKWGTTGKVQFLFSRSFLLGYNSIKFWDFHDISWFPKILSRLGTCEETRTCHVY